MTRNGRGEVTNEGIVRIQEEQIKGCFDELLDGIGFGKYQAIIYILPVLNYITIPVHNFGTPFLDAVLPFRCTANMTEILNCGMDGDNCRNISDVTIYRNNSFYDSLCISPVDPKIMSEIWSAGRNYLQKKQHKTYLSSCPIVEYDTSKFQSTIVSDFHLICERAYLRPLFITFFAVGSMFGSALAGYIGDRYGRIMAVKIGVIFYIISLLIMAVSPNYAVLLLARFITGVSSLAAFVASWNIGIECTPTLKRSVSGVFISLPFSCSIVAVAGIAYMVRKYVLVALLGSSPAILLLLASLMVPESPRWLLQRGHIEEARVILKWAAKLNKTDSRLNVDSYVDILAKIMTTEPHSKVAEETPVKLSTLEKIKNMVNLFFGPAMRAVTLCLAISGLVQSFLYNGFGFNANNFTSDPFLYIALTGLTDCVAMLLITPLAMYFKRRTLLITGFSCSGILFLIELIIPEEWQWLRWSLAMSGFFLISGSYQVNFIYTSEVYPTEIRARGFALQSVLGSIGTTIAPLVTGILSMSAAWAPTAVFGCAGIIGGISFLPLPETKDRPLPDTVQEVEEKLREKRGKRKCCEEKRKVFKGAKRTTEEEEIMMQD